MTSVKVAVRVRPFNTREKAANSRSIIRMEGNNTYITNPVSGQSSPIYWLCLLRRKTARRKSLDSTIAIGATMASTSQNTRSNILLRSQGRSTSTRTLFFKTW